MADNDTDTIAHPSIEPNSQIDIHNATNDSLEAEDLGDLFSQNFDILKDIMTDLTSQNLKRTHENIIDKFATKNYSIQLAEEILDIALERQLICSYRYAQKLNYKINATTSQTAIISDPVADVSINTDITMSPSDSTQFVEAPSMINISSQDASEKYVTSSELSQLKSDLLKEICAITPQSSPQMTPQPQQNLQEPLVNILLKHIDFLQNTITTLVNKIDSSQQKPLPTSLMNPPVHANIHPASIKPTVASKTTASVAEITAPKIAASSATSQAVPAISTQIPSASTTTPVTTPTQNKKQFSKKQVLIVGDSMLNCIDEVDLRRDAFVRVRNHPGATVEDLIDHVRAHTRHIKHDGVIIMAGANDISQNNMDENKDKPDRSTTHHLSELIKELKEQLPPASHIAVCQITARKDSAKATKDVHKLNAEFKLLAEREHIGFVNTSQFTKEHTGKKGIHPNERGVDKLHETFEKYIRKISRL